MTDVSMQSKEALVLRLIAARDSVDDSLPAAN